MFVIAFFAFSAFIAFRNIGFPDSVPFILFTFHCVREIFFFNIEYIRHPYAFLLAVF